MATIMRARHKHNDDEKLQSTTHRLLGSTVSNGDDDDNYAATQIPRRYKIPN